MNLTQLKSAPEGSPAQMTPAELKATLQRLYGYGWQTKAATDLGVNTSTIRRWVGGRPMSKMAVTAVRALEERASGQTFR